MERLRIGSFFSGIGAFEKALERLEIPHETVFYCEIDKYASKAYSLIHNVPESFNLWDITKVDETKLPDFDLMTWGFPCFPGGTLVMTSKGHKEIQDINVGDKVLTHKNRFKKVVKTMQKPCSALYNVKVFGVEEFNVTAEHPFYVRKFKRVWDCANKTNKRLFGEPEWVEVKDLDKNCYIGIAINQKSKLPLWQGYEYKHQNRITKCKNELNFENENLWWLIGRYMGDGWTSVTDRKSKPNSPNYRTIICCAKSEINDITQKLDGLFSYSVAEERTVYKIHIVNKELTLFLQQFGQGASNKRITSDILNLPVCLLESFLKGYFSADGCYSQGLYKATSVSRQLTYGIQACIYKVYRRPCALYKNKRPKTSVIEGRTINQKDTYNIAFKKENGKQDKAFYEDGYIWIPFRRKDVIEFNDDVYNFEVEEDNSYTAFNLIVHNCQDISVAGKQAGIVEGETRSGLYYDGLRILKHKMPKYSIIENVKNLTSEKFRPIFHQILCDLEDAGYHSYYEVLNAKDYGIPQNRERIFIVSIRKDVDQGFVFPLPFDNGLRLKDLLEDEVDEKYFISQEKTEKLIESLKDKDTKHLKEQPYMVYTPVFQKAKLQGPRLNDGSDYSYTLRADERFTHGILTIGNINPSGHGMNGNVYAGDVSPTITTNKGEGLKIAIPVLAPDIQEKKQNGRRFKEDGEPMFSLTTQDRHGILQINEPTVFEERKDEGMRFFNDGVCGTLRTISECGDKRVIYPNYRIRKLTPLECFRLMGFDDDDFLKLKYYTRIESEELLKKYPKHKGKRIFSHEERVERISDSQLYKMAGNSIVVQVLEGILDNLLKSGVDAPDCFYGEQMNLFG